MDTFNNIDVLFITNPTNIRYLTGFVGVEPGEREVFVLLTINQIFLFTSGLYREQATQLSNNPIIQFSNNPIRFIEISREKPISKELMKICDEQGIKKLEFEETNLTVAELRKLDQVLTDVDLVPTQDRIENMRIIKRKDEIENIRRAATITDQCYSYITKRIRPGATEARLAWEIESFLKMKAGDIAFSPIVAFNEHSSQPHYHSHGNNPLRKNSLILLDFGARVNGYCADMTRVVFLGTPTRAWSKAYETVLASNQKAIDLLKTGERNGATLDAAAREVIAVADLPVYSHSLGHAVGLDIHEAPRLTVKKQEKLEPNMVFTVEPGVYVDGQYGIRIEDLVLLKEHSVEILSKSPKGVTIL